MTKPIVRIFLSKEQRGEDLVRVGDTRIDYLEWGSPFDIRRAPRNLYETETDDEMEFERAPHDNEERRADLAEGYYVVADLREENPFDGSGQETRPRWLN
jgi:hypothetical protein